MNVPIQTIAGFQQRDRQDSEFLNNGTFCILPVTIAQSIIRKRKWPDAGIKINYDDDDYSQVYGRFEEVLTTLTKRDILQPCTTDHDFRSSIIGAHNFGSNLYVFGEKFGEISQLPNQLK